MSGTSVTSRPALVALAAAFVLASGACTTSTAAPMATTASGPGPSPSPAAGSARPTAAATGSTGPATGPAGESPEPSVPSLPDPGVDTVTGARYPNLIADGSGTGSGLVRIPRLAARVRTVTVHWVCFGTGTFLATSTAGDALTRAVCGHSTGFSYSADIPARLLHGHGLVLHLPAHSYLRYAVTTD